MKRITSTKKIGVNMPGKGKRPLRGPIQNLSDDDDDDFEERNDEKPQVVQIKPGDLTEEEAKRIEKEEAQKPADLNERIIFKVKKKKDDDDDKKDLTAEKSKPKEKKSRKSKPTKNLLSFDEEEDGD